MDAELAAANARMHGLREGMMSEGSRKFIEQRRRGFFGSACLFSFWGWNAWCAYNFIDVMSRIEQQRSGLTSDAARAGHAIGAAIGLNGFLMEWLLVAGLLGLAAFMTRGKREMIEVPSAPHIASAQYPQSQKWEYRDTRAKSAYNRKALWWVAGGLACWAALIAAFPAERSLPAAGAASPEFQAKVDAYKEPSPGAWRPAVVTASQEIPAQKEVLVASDMKARYFDIGVTSKPGKPPRIVTRREGPSGTSFSNRECDCQSATFRYLGDGESTEAMNASRPEAKMTRLVSDGNGFGSVSFHVCFYACKSVGTTISETKTARP